MFIYLNVTEGGEVIGSDPSCTLVIEDCGLEKKHAQIRQEHDDQQKRFAYYLRSWHSTFIKIRYDVPTFFKNNMEIQIGKLRYILRVANTYFNEVNEFLMQLDLHHVNQIFEAKGTNTLKKIRAIPLDVWAKELQNINNAEQSFERFKEAYNLIDAVQIHQNHRLALIDYTSQKVVIDIGWAGATISSFTKVYQKPPDILLKRLDFQDFDDTADFELSITYYYGKYYLYTNKCDQQNVFYKQQSDEFHILYPDDVIQVGSLELLVERFNTGIAQDIGGRNVQEDGYAILQDLQVGRIPVSCFAVFDGHNGDQCMKYIQFNLLDNLRQIINQEEYEMQPKFIEFMRLKLRESFRLTDDNFYNEFKDDKAIQSGAVCALVVIVGDYIFSANCGDCRGILSKNGMAVQLTTDHKASCENEKARIISKGGEINEGRVGKLAISRAFGDFSQKKQLHRTKRNIVTVTPEVAVYHLDYKQDEFLVICSDGIIDGFGTNQAIVDFIHQDYKSQEIGKQDPQAMARSVLMKAYSATTNSKRGSDNLTCCIVNLTRGIQ